MVSLTAPSHSAGWRGSSPRDASVRSPRLVFDGRAWARQDHDVERDARLVTASLENKSDFRHLVTLYQGRVYGTALRITGSESDAADATQEAFIRAFRALDRFEIGRPFGPWICTIAANVARDQLRDPIRRITRVSLSVFGDRRAAPAKHAPDRPLEDDDRRDAMATALIAVKPKLREALVLRYVSGLSIDEVAASLNIKESAAKMRIKRGLESLREILGDSAAELLRGTDAE